MDRWIDGWMGKYIAIISPQRILCLLTLSKDKGGVTIYYI